MYSKLEIFKNIYIYIQTAKNKIFKKTTDRVCRFSAFEHNQTTTKL